MTEGKRWGGLLGWCRGLASRYGKWCKVMLGFGGWWVEAGEGTRAKGEGACRCEGLVAGVCGTRA
eukprot:scaffold169410_cov18-Tisochrysis_lutea.AAC.1